MEAFWPEINDQGLRLHLDLLQERRDQAKVTIAAYQEHIARYFNRKVQHRSFKVEDWVMRKVTVATKDSTEGKLTSS